jgi:integrase
LAESGLLGEECVKQYLEFVGPEFVKNRKHYALAKVLSIAVEACDCKSVSEFLDACRNNGNGLHVVLQKVVNRLREQYTPKTVWFYVWLLSSFLDFHNIDVARARRKLKMPKKATTRVDRIPTLSEVQRLILGSKSPRLRLLIQLLLQTGMRLNEALHLRVSDIDFNAKVIRVSAAFTKRADKRELPLVPELEEAIKKYLEKRQVQSVWLFPSLENPSRPMAKERAQDSFNQLLRRLGLDQRDPSGLGYQIHFHVFRKWHKTMLERAGVNRLVLERWQGRDIGSQGVYFLPTGDDLKRETEKAAEALRIFGKVEEPKPELDLVTEWLVARHSVLALKMVENALLERRASAIILKDKAALAEIDRKLEAVRVRMSELTSKLSEEELAKIDRLADEIS